MAVLLGEMTAALEHFPPMAPRFECICSRGRSGRMLQALGRMEVDSILAERGDVEITCGFGSARSADSASDSAPEQTLLG